MSKSNKATVSTAAIKTASAVKGSNGTYGDDIIAASADSVVRATTSVRLAHTYAARYERLLPLVRAPGANVRDLVLNDWATTASAQDFMKRFEAMRDAKDKTKAQKDTFRMWQEIKDKLNTTIIRALDTFEGIQLLRSKGRVITVRRMPHLKDDVHIYTCNMIFENTALPEVEREDAPIPLNAAELMRVASVIDKITPKLDSTAVKALLSVQSQKAQTPNVEKAPGNGVAIDASNMGVAIASLDTAISTHLRSDGHTIAGSKATNEAMHLLWAKLDAVMTEAQKIKARKVYAAEADKAAQAEAARVAAEAAIKVEADKSAKAVTAKVQAA